MSLSSSESEREESMGDERSEPLPEPGEREVDECECEGLVGELGSDGPDYIDGCQRERDAARTGTQ